MRPWFLLTLILASCGKGTDPPGLVEGAEGSLRLTGDGAEAMVELTPRVPELGELFGVRGRLELDLPEARIAFVKLDARMPGHGHGMLTEPVTRLGEAGTFVAEGLKLHMFGDWQFVLEVRLTDGMTKRLGRPFRFDPEGVRADEN